jgi:conjugative transfer signal peptidase TraF
MNRIAGGAAVMDAALLLLGAGWYAAGARINTTRSIPIGLYWTTGQPVAKGAYVLFCPPQAAVFDEARTRGYITAGFCPGDYGYLMKRVLAANDDVVSIGADGVRVNGALLPLSMPVKTDTAGRPLARHRAAIFTLRQSEVLLMSDVSATSFDGRYFGPVDPTQIRSVITPVVTW